MFLHGRHGLSWLGIQLMLGFMVDGLYSGKCDTISDFVYVCLQNDTIFILSANPCNQTTSVSLSVIHYYANSSSEVYFKSHEFTHTSDSVSRIDNSDLGYAWEIHPHYPNGSSASVFHVSLFMASSNGLKPSNWSYSGMILEVYFQIYPQQCKLVAHRSSESLEKSVICAHTVETDFTSLCQYGYGMILTVADFCTIPYSVAVMTIWLDLGTKFLQKFTASRLQPLIPMTVWPRVREEPDPKNYSSLLRSSCGMVLSTGDERSHGPDRVALFHQCDGGLRSAITNRYFTNYAGSVCPWSNCSIDSLLQRTCSSSWLAGNADVRNTVITVELDICHVAVYAVVSIKVDGYPNMFLQALRATDVNETGLMYPLDLGNDDASEEGYLPLSGGKINLHVSERKDFGIFHVMVLRHYPAGYDAMVLFQDYFFANRSTVCRFNRKVKAAHAWKIIVPVVVVVFLIVVIFVCVWKRKTVRVRKFGDDGLAYNMEIPDEDFDAALDDDNRRL